MAAPYQGTPLPGFCLPDPERGREVRGTERRHRDGGQAPVSLTTAPGRSPSSGPGEGRERRDPRAGTAAARGAPPGLSGLGPHPGARAYRVCPLQVTLLVAKGRDVDLHGCAWRRRTQSRDGSRPPLRPGPPPRLSPLRPRDPRLRGVDPGPPRSRRPRAPAGLAPHRGTGSGGAGARGCGRPGSRPKVCGDRLGPEEAGPETCESAERGVRTSARAGVGLGRGRSLPFGGSWICHLETSS